jgi:hypothetical protein
MRGSYFISTRLFEKDFPGVFPVVEEGEPL